MTDVSPFEIVAGPATILVANANTAKPDVAATSGSPYTSYTQLGANGAKNYDESGVQLTYDQTLSAWSALGSTGIRKVWRTNEVLTLDLTIMDLTAEAYARIVNNNAITTVAAGTGIAGSKKVSNLQGMDVALMALLIRCNYSPYGAGWNLQHWLPVMYQSGKPTPAYVKGKPAGLHVTFSSVEDVTNGFGVSEFQNATPQ